MGEFLDILDDLRGVFKELFKNKNFRRWAIELSVTLIVGITAGCITYNVLNKNDKGLKVADENAVAISDDQVAGSGNAEAGTDSSENTAVVEDDFSNAVVTVTDPSSYAATVSDWSAEEIEAAISERKGYLENNKYWSVVKSYWENTRGVTDNSCYCTYLFETSSKIYTTDDFKGVPAEVIHLAKNEIYARHGYSFKDKEIYNYFMGQIWYTPSVMPADFNEDTFTETEVKNLDLLNSLDTM